MKEWKYFILAFCFRPILSEKNELLVQFLSDLSLTADGFIGHYKFRPKKLPTTTALPTTTTVPATSSKFTGSISFPIKIIYSRTRRELQKYKIEIVLKTEVLKFVSILNVEGIN